MFNEKKPFELQSMYVFIDFEYFGQDIWHLKQPNKYRIDQQI